MNNHQNTIFHQVGNFLKTPLALLGVNLKNSRLNKIYHSANHPYLCKGLYNLKARLTMNLLTIPLTAITLLLLPFHSSAQSWNQNPQNFNSNYNIQAVTGLSLDKRALLGGKVISSAQVSLLAQVSGDVLSINGKEGDMFKRGAILVMLEQKAIQAQRDAANAEIASANEALKNAGVQYSQSIVSPNSSGMFGGIPGMFSMFTDPMLRASGRGDPDFDKFANRTSRYTQYQQAKYKLTQARLKLKQMEERLKDANVVAPFDGVITAKNVNQGDVVRSGQMLLKFANIDKLQVELNVPSRLVSSLRINKEYRIKLDIANIVVNAALSQIYPIADNNKHSVKVKFDLPKNTPVLAGAYAEVEIFEADSGVLTPIIPESAVLWRSSLPSIFVINPQTNKTELRFVRLGEQVGKNKKSVLSGLKIGERIVVNPNILMISGMSI
ncbi:FIG01199357: hypothetical protein [uncultured Candidatus Thioglobus sp.]|nr:FIG01199357: hypothetical protein [uncultured Candidatus Thioglobus sp.]